ncbi:MAG TPA: dihydroneopterin aldolase [Armatimonadota bacterium]|jgi:dihydroneopterin aldolase
MVGIDAPDKIILAGIQFRGHHGDSEEERKVGGRFEVDVIIGWNNRRTEGSDRLRDTVDYYSVHKRILEIGQTERHQMVETLAGQLARMVLREFHAPEVTVKVRKLLPPLEGIVAYAGVEITRRQGDYVEE